MNIYELPPLPLTEELVTTLVEDQRLRIERIISTGQVSGWYNQEEIEYVLLLEGEAVIEFEHNQLVTLHKGDSLVLPAHRLHRVNYTSTEPPCIWLCVFARSE